MDNIKQIVVPHSEMNYDERFDISHFKGFDWKNPKKADGSPMTPYELKCTAVHFARANGFKETGMSVNEIALLYDVLEKKGACNIVELGRNFGCSTRLMLQNVIRKGGTFQSWDLKHWDGFIEGMRDNGYLFGDFETHEGHAYGPMRIQEGINVMSYNVKLLVADSVKTPIVSPKENEDRFVDFLLIDTEHGLEHALGEYMRWRNYLNSGAMIAFHDSTLPGVVRAIEIVKEVEDMASPGSGRICAEWVNERVDGYGIQVLEWKG